MQKRPDEPSPGAGKCPCGITLDLELVDLQAQDRYKFRGELCAQHAAEMRGYWDQRFHGART